MSAGTSIKSSYQERSEFEPWSDQVRALPVPLCLCVGLGLDFLGVLQFPPTIQRCAIDW